LLIDAIWLKPVCITDNICAILYLIVILTHRKFKCLLPLDGKFSAHHKGCQLIVTTTYDDRITRLEETIKQKDKEISKILKSYETELLKIKAVVNSFTLQIKPLPRGKQM